jgi:ATP-binding cassette, subfamily B, bacterial
VSSSPGNGTGLYALLWPHLRPQSVRLAVAVGVGLVLAALSAAQPLLTRIVIDEGLIGGRYARLAWACAAILLAAVAGAVLGAVHRLLYIRASGRALLSLRGDIYGHLLTVPPRVLGTMPIGELLSRLDGDVAEVQRFGTDSVATVISAGLSMAVMLGVMLRLSWQLTTVLVALLPLQLLIRHYARPKLERATRALRESSARLSGFLVETLAGARLIQGSATERLEVARLGSLSNSYLDRVIDQQLVSYGTASLASVFGHVATTAVFLVGGWYVVRGGLTVGTLVAFAAYLGRSAAVASSVGGLYTSYQRARVSLLRVLRLCELRGLVDDPAARPLPADAAGRLQLIGVAVAGRGDEAPVFSALDLEIPAGIKVVLRGPSGAGKTTLVDLLRRFVEPARGQILLDGFALDSYRLADVRRRIVVVDHSPVLFRGTIADNLRYGASGVSDDAVRQAARVVGLDAVAASLPAGYETDVGESGAALSTGQRQRVALGRAVLADPLVVILDEATSGLHPEGVAELHQALDAALPGRTRIIVTHGLTPVPGALIEWRLTDGVLHRSDLGS